MKKLLINLIAASALSFSTSAFAANIVETAQKAGSFETLLAAAKAAGLAGALANGKNLTVFAPTDEAFAALPAGTVESLLKPENKDQLVAVLSYHVLPRQLKSNMLPHHPIHVKTLNKSNMLAVSINGHHTSVKVNNAKVVAADIKASNGTIHVIDKVLLPKK